MNPKRAGIVFLIQILVTIGASLLLVIGSSFFTLGILANVLVSELILLVPCFFMVGIFEYPGRLWNNKMCADGLISTGGLSFQAFFMLIAAIIFSGPIVTFANSVSLLFVENEVVANRGEFMSLPMPLLILLSGIVAPVCEELAFRGVILGGLRRSKSIFWAVIIQAFLFGLVHMNLNQFCYAFVAGIIMGFMVEATGTILSSLIFHMFINCSTTVLMYFTADLYEIMDVQIDKVLLIEEVCILSVIAFVCVVIVGCLLYGMSCKQGRDGYFVNIFKNKTLRGSGVLSLPLLIGIIVAVIMIAIELVLKYFIS